MSVTLRLGSALAAALALAACSSPSPERADVAALEDSAAGERILVLGAFPTEVDALLRRADVRDTTVIDGRSFFSGTLGGAEVVIGMTGIGLVNAERTARAAIEAFAPSAILFSGVSGTKYRIGDVMIPARWTEDGGETWVAVDLDMLALAQAVAGEAALGRCAAVGDPVCVGVALPIDLSCVAFEPEVIVGGDGRSSDPFDGRSLPCVPLGGDVFGCDACLAPEKPLPDLAGFAEDTAAFLDPDLFADFAAWSENSTSGFDVDDMETAAVARVAGEAGIPFLGIRSASDGAGDPLGLPGFPVQFFAYRVLAAENAAAVTTTFLDHWSAR